MPNMGRSENKTILRQTSTSSTGNSTASPKGRLNFFKKWPSASGSSGTPPTVHREDSGSSDHILGREVSCKMSGLIAILIQMSSPVINPIKSSHLPSYSPNSKARDPISLLQTLSVPGRRKTATTLDYVNMCVHFAGFQVVPIRRGWTRYGTNIGGAVTMHYISV